LLPWPSSAGRKCVGSSVCTTYWCQDSKLLNIHLHNGAIQFVGLHHNLIGMWRIRYLRMTSGHKAGKPQRWWPSHVFRMWHVMHSSRARGTIHWLRSQTLLTPPTLQWLATGFLQYHIHDLDEKWQSHAQPKRVWLRFVVTLKLLFGLGQRFWNFSDVLLCSISYSSVLVTGLCHTICSRVNITSTRRGLYGTKFWNLRPQAVLYQIQTLYPSSPNKVRSVHSILYLSDTPSTDVALSE
jgi:hypothetical protein